MSTRAERGFALVLVLWVGALLAMVVGTLAFGARSEVSVVRGSVDLARAEMLAAAGVERAIVGVLERDRRAKWRGDGAPYRFALGDGVVTVRVRAERGKVDLNAAPEDVLRGLFAAAGSRMPGLEPGAAEAVAAAVLDWRDADRNPRPGGGESAAYAAAGLPWEPPDAPFATVSELRRVLGVSAPLYAMVAPELTVNGSGTRLDPQTASAMVLEAVPGANPDDVAAFLVEREAWASGGQDGDDVGLSFPAQLLSGLERYLARGASPFYTVISEARTASGRVARCTALLRVTGRAARPVEIIAWDLSGVVPTAADGEGVAEPAEPGEPGEPG